MKNKILKISLSTAAVAAIVTPIATLASCHTTGNTPVDPVDPVTPEQEKIFNISNDTVYGFKEGVTQEQVDEYCKNGVFKMPAVKNVADNAFNAETTGIKINAGTLNIENATATIGAKSYYAQGYDKVTWNGAELPSDSTTLHTIGDLAFAFCKELTSFAIPKSLFVTDTGKGIGKSTFLGCSSLATLHVMKYQTTDDGKPLWANATFAGLPTTGTITFHGTQADPAYTFSRLAYAGINPAWTASHEGTSFTTPYKMVPEEYLTIKNNVFMGCNKYLWPDSEKNFDVVILPSGVTSIDASVITNTFFQNKSLDSDNKGVRRWNLNKTTISTIPADTFKNITNTASNCYIALPDTIKTIGDNAFNNCKYSLADFSTNLVESIGANAFDGSNITSWKFTKKLQADQTVGSSAFANCEKLAKLDFTVWGAEDDAPAWTTPTDIFKTSGTTETNEITMTLFEDDPIGQLALQLKFEKLFKAQSLGTDTQKWTFNPNASITEQSQLFSIDTDTGKITGWAKTKAGTELSAELIGQIFDSKTEWAGKLVIPTAVNGTNVTGIDANAFYNTTSKLPSQITSIEFPSSIANFSIGANAFEKATYITSIKIPNKVSEVGSNAFDGCSALATIDVSDWEALATPSWTGTQIFANCPTTGIVTVKDYLGTDPTAADQIDQWRNNSGIKELLNVKGGLTFGTDEWAVSVTDSAIPYLVTNNAITGWAVGNATASTALTSTEKKALMLEKYGSNDFLYIPKEITAINDNAFITDEVDPSTTIPDGLVKLTFEDSSTCTNIGANAFYKAPFTTINFPDSSSLKIGEKAFAETKITSLTLTANIADVGDGAFSNISTLASLTFPVFSADTVNFGASIFAKDTTLATIDMTAYTTAVPQNWSNETKNMLDGIATSGTIKCAANMGTTILNFLMPLSYEIRTYETWILG